MWEMAGVEARCNGHGLGQSASQGPESAMAFVDVARARPAGLSACWRQSARASERKAFTAREGAPDTPPRTPPPAILRVGQ